MLTNKHLNRKEGGRAPVFVSGLFLRFSHPPNWDGTPGTVTGESIVVKRHHIIHISRLISGPRYNCRFLFTNSATQSSISTLLAPLHLPPPPPQIWSGVAQILGPPLGCLVVPYGGVSSVFLLVAMFPVGLVFFAPSIMRTVRSIKVCTDMI